ncbi:MAG: response regulator [Elusimicrobia bacterium]|nr:response regulator [Elusimicrobiota bacterium]
MKKILIADDEKNLSQIFKDELEDLGYSVDIVETGLTAISYIENAKPDLVILDISLPDINGIKVLQQLKDEYPALPVIMCTGYGQFEEYYQRFTDKEIEFYSYLVKPIALEKLVTTVKNAIGEP